MASLPDAVRRQLPVYSPTTFRSLIDGFLGASGVEDRDSVLALIKQHWSAAHVVLTDSGTSALSLAIKVAVPPNGVVALPAWGCYDLATAAVGADVRVALYDVDPETLAPVPDSLKSAVARGARALVVAHFYGVPVDMDVIRRMATTTGVTVIDDAAQGIGARWRGRPVGALGDLGVLSFGRGKGLSGGGGGALLVNARDEGYDRVQVDDGHAGWGELVRASAQWLLARPRLYAVPASIPFLKLGETVYHPPHPPQALARASARMLSANWPHAHAATEARRRNAERLRRYARQGEWRNVEIVAGGEAGYLRLPVLGTRTPEKMREGAALGIMPGYPETLYSLEPLRARCINANQGFPGAEHLARSLVTLPAHELLTDADLEKIGDWLKR